MAAATIGDLITALSSDTTASAAATAALVAANTAATAAAQVVTTDQTSLAAGLKAVGDVVVENSDGTFTGYFADSSASGFHTEVLKGATTPLPAPDPEPTPEPTPTPNPAS